MPAKFELIAPCFFGCESTANFELRRIGAEDIRVSDGRLTFKGGADMIAAANLNLRTVERVMLLLNTYPATTFDELFDGVYSIPWEELLPADAAFPVSGSSLNSQLSSVPACQSIIKKAVVKRLMQFHHTSVLPETGAEYKIRFMLRKNVCEIMLDTTGEGLHKRGYRRNAMEAPIRETLAATIADLGRVRRDSLVEDPFCGSGTLLIEAAQKAMNIAPGLKRRFAAERYSFVPAAVWAEQRQKALADSKLDAGFEAFGYDIDPAAVALANANAKLAGVEKRCHFEVADVADFAAKSEAIVLTNPPYGERMSTIEGAAKLAKTLELKIKDLYKSYDHGKTYAINDVSADFTPGIYGILGPNGAGKSTMFGMLTDNLRPDKGSITADGEDIYKMGADYRAKIGYMPQQQSLYEAFTAEKFLWYMAALKGMNRKDAREQIENLLEVVNLKEERYKKLKYFSGGMKQRILLAQALLNDPEILILDEPTAGMDPEERIRIRNFISGCAKDKIVLLATHVVADVENMAREILLIKNGKIVRRDTPQKFLAELEHKVYNVLVTEREGEEYQNSGARIISVTLTEKGHRLRIISADALKTGNVEEVYPCLEDVYLYWIDRE